MKRYSRRKKEAWEAKAFAFLVVTMIFACFADSEGFAYTIAMSGVIINALLAGICEIFASRWS